MYVQSAISPAQRSPDLTASNPRSDSVAGRDSPLSPESSREGAPARVEDKLARANGPVRGADRGEDFSVTCAPAASVSAGTIPPAATCKADSYSGFTGRIELSCAQPPAGLSCKFAPASVSPPANGSEGFQLLLVSDAVSPGSYVFDVVGKSGGKENRFTYPFFVSTPGPVQAPLTAPVTGNTALPAPVPVPPPPAPTPAEPTFTIACTLAADPRSGIDKLLFSLTQGPKGTIKCLVTPRNGFDEEVTLDLANGSDQIVYSFSPATIQPKAEGSSFVDLNFELSGLEKGKVYRFDVIGTSPNESPILRRVELTITD